MFSEARLMSTNLLRAQPATLDGRRRLGFPLRKASLEIIDLLLVPLK